VTRLQLKDVGLELEPIKISLPYKYLGKVTDSEKEEGKDDPTHNA
jgi:hypothetical protein